MTASMQRRRALWLALLVLVQLLATAHGKRPATSGSGDAAQTAPLSGRRLPKRFSNAAVAEAAMSRIAANQPADMIVTFKVSRSDIDEQAAQIASNPGLAAADGVAPASAAPLSRRAVRRAARKRANALAKQGVLSRRAARRGARINRDFPSLPVAVLTINSSEALQALQSDPAVLAVEPRIMFHTTGRGLLRDFPPLGSPQEGGFGGASDALGVDGGGGRRRLLLKQSLPMIGAPEAAAAGYTGKGCAVAVIDSGADYTHPDLGGCTAPGVPESTCRVSVAHDFHLDDYDDGQLDDMGHGTNVASIVAQAAPEAKIIAIDVFRKVQDSAGESWGANYDDILGAIEWVLDNRDELNVCTINMSLGSSCGSGSTPLGCPACPNTAIAQTIALARSLGVLTAVASGNEALSTGLAFPACAPAAFSVGAVYDADVPGGQGWGNPQECRDEAIVKEQVCCFSNSASYLTALAPGAWITAGGYRLPGTSQAAPHVAATLAVLRAAFRNATMDAIVEAVTTTGKEITDSRNNVKKPLINTMQAATKLYEAASIPAGTVQINGGAQWTGSQAVALSIQATNAVEMCVASEAAAPCTPYEAYATSKNWQLPAGDGDKSVFVYFRNAAGRVSDPPANASITLDATAPSGAALTIDGGEQFASTPEVALTISGTDNYPDGLQMCIANAATSDCSPYEAFAASKLHTLSDGDGAKTVFLYLRDAAGNAASAQAEITLLSTPSGSVAINSGAAWTNSPAVALSIAAGDGVTQTCVADTDVGAAACTPWEQPPEASKPWQLPAGDGDKSVFVYFRNAGMQPGEPATDSITLDTTAPANASLTVNDGAPTTSTPEVALTISGTDNYPDGLQMCIANAATSDCSPYEAFAASKLHTLSDGDGAKTVFLYLRDAAGNAASAQAEITLLSGPSGSVAINSGAAWTNSPAVALSITAGDGVTQTCVADTDVGAAACTPWEQLEASKPWQLPAGDGDKSVFVYFRNAVNKTSEPATDSIVLDTTAPSGAAVTINDGAEWAAGTSVSLAISGTDNYPDGLQMCLSDNQTAAGACTPYEAFAATKAWELTAGEGSRSVYLWLQDVCGNSAGTSASIKVDMQPPSNVVVSINGGAAQTASLDVNVTITASDFSGVDKMCLKTAAGAACAEADFVPFTSPVAVSLPAGALGPRYVYVTLRDARGNTMSAPASDQITYNDPAVTSNVTVAVTNANSAGWVTSPDVLFAVTGSGASSVSQICMREDSAPCTSMVPFTNPMPYTLSSTEDGQRTVFVTLESAVPPASANQAAPPSLTVPVNFAADLNPPTGSVSLASSSTGATASPHLTLALAATDISGVSQVCITDDPAATAATCWPWRPYSASQSFTLASSKGASKVLAFFRDANSHTSAGVAANVTVDTTKPKAKKRDMELKATPSSSSIALTWNKDGATDDASSVAGFFVLYRPNYTPNSCKSRRKRTKRVDASLGADGTVTATVTGLKPSRQYGFRFCPVDGAGNIGGGVTKLARTTSARRG